MTVEREKTTRAEELAMKPEGTEEEPAVKFVGVVQSYNEEKNFGMISSNEATQLWDKEVYAYKDVLESCGAGVGDTVCFGIHVNKQGMPQASIPMYKIGEDGMPENVLEGSFIVFAEEEAAKDPSFLENLKEQIENKSQHQNSRRGGKGDRKGGKGGKGGGGDWNAGWGKGGGGGGRDAWGGKTGKGGGKGGAKGSWGKPVTTLWVGNIPAQIPRREVAHIFRQYAGFTDLRIMHRDSHTNTFVDFETHEQAEFVAEALNGYIWDLEGHPDQAPLSVTLANPKRGRAAPY